jgi:hypothetical protein
MDGLYCLVPGLGSLAFRAALSGAATPHELRAVVTRSKTLPKSDGSGKRRPVRSESDVSRGVVGISEIILRFDAQRSPGRIVGNRTSSFGKNLRPTWVLSECPETVLFEASVVYFWASELSTVLIHREIAILGSEGFWAGFGFPSVECHHRESEKRNRQRVEECRTR